MRVSRSMQIGVLLVVVLLATILALQLTTSVGQATVYPIPRLTPAPTEPLPMPEPSETQTDRPDHNNWAWEPPPPE